MLLHLDNYQIGNLEDRKRIALINSLSGFKSLNLIGTINNQGQTNLAIFNSVVHIGANPPLMGFISRPDSVEKHTIENIRQTSYYTINHVNINIFEQAHQTSARYKRDESEFVATGLTPEYKNSFPAPFVSESNIQIGLELQEIISVKTNNTLLVVGEIKHLFFPNDIWEDSGVLDIEKAGSVTGSSLDGYHSTQLITRLKYSKP